MNETISIKSRDECILLIRTRKKEKAFKKLYERIPEEYFAEYAGKEPEIWQSVLSDLNIHPQKLAVGDRIRFRLPNKRYTMWGTLIEIHGRLGKAQYAQPWAKYRLKETPVDLRFCVKLPNR